MPPPSPARSNVARRRKRTKRAQNPTNGTETQGDGGTVDESNQGMETVDEGETPRPRRVSVDRQIAAHMNIFVDRLTAAGVAGLQREYAQLKAFLPPNRTFTAFAANRTRNRYTDQVCYDVTRVKLTYNVPPDTDYIHANVVDLPDLAHRFICAQGPLPDTVGDWWRMIFQERAPAIIMLCKWEEGGQPKCHPYYPITEGETRPYGLFVVRNMKSERNFDRMFECIHLEMAERSGGPVHKVTLFAWKDWPDKGVPSSGMGVLRLLRHLQRFRNPKGKPTIVVHCSAGVGRTGTVVALAILMSRLQDKKPYPVFENVRDLRCRRHNAVQTEGQYLFIHRTLCEYIQAKGFQRPALSQFAADYAAYVRNPPPPPVFVAPAAQPQIAAFPQPMGAVQQTPQPFAPQAFPRPPAPAVHQPPPVVQQAAVVPPAPRAVYQPPPPPQPQVQQAAVPAVGQQTPPPPPAVQQPQPRPVVQPPAPAVVPQPTPAVAQQPPQAWVAAKPAAPATQPPAASQAPPPTQTPAATQPAPPPAAAAKEPFGSQRPTGAVPTSTPGPLPNATPTMIGPAPPATSSRETAGAVVSSYAPVQMSISATETPPQKHQ